MRQLRGGLYRKGLNRWLDGRARAGRPARDDDTSFPRDSGGKEVSLQLRPVRAHAVNSLRGTACTVMNGNELVTGLGKTLWDPLRLSDAGASQGFP